MLVESRSNKTAISAVRSLTEVGAAEFIKTASKNENGGRSTAAERAYDSMRYPIWDRRFWE